MTSNLSKKVSEATNKIYKAIDSHEEIMLLEYVYASLTGESLPVEYVDMCLDEEAKLLKSQDKRSARYYALFYTFRKMQNDYKQLHELLNNTTNDGIK